MGGNAEMKKVKVDLGERSYEIEIGTSLSVGTSLSGGSGLRALLISDSNVDPLHGDNCEKQLRSSEIDVCRVVVPAGEQSKSLDCVKDLYAKALDCGLDRTSVIVALGGGVVGDLAGFVAATFLRGIRFIQVPTTLLAMVDSSVGGKTGVNIPQGKNLIGAFYQPVEVVVDLLSLDTLPEREYVSGLAEVVKYGVIWDAELFSKLEANVSELLSRDADVLGAVVARCCEIKAEVVASDEKETGLRAILNFGHTLGHALENVSGYGRWLHGEALSIGIVYAAALSVEEKGFAVTEYERVVNLLREFGLPVCLSEADAAVTWSDLRVAIGTDKKTERSIPKFVLTENLGSSEFGCEIAEDVLERVFKVEVMHGSGK